MEVRARYVLMGAFTLAVIAGVFAFVYWLDAAGGLTQRSAFKVRFDSPVAGLLRGSAVLFNGVRVGEVVDLQLDAKQPGDVVVGIAVDRATPVRADTRIRIDFQGLAGAPVVSMVGGTASLPILAPPAGDAPVLVAEKNAGQGMTQIARQVLLRLDAVISENADPLKSTIASINTFSEALARNSGKVDGIFAGLERLTGGGDKQALRVFDLSAAKFETALPRQPSGQLLIIEPTALAALDSQRVHVSGSGANKLDLSGVRWPDILSKVLQTRIIQSFESAGYSGAVARTMEEVQTDHRLITNVRVFEVSVGERNEASVELAAKIVDQTGRVVASQVIRARTPFTEIAMTGALEALDDASRQCLKELVGWVSGRLAGPGP